MPILKKSLAWLTDQLLCLSVSFLTGVKPKSRIELDFSPQQKVYYANHGSHGDFLLVWISLPRRWRIHTRPVAGSDYWLTGRIRRFIIQNVFNALLIPRHSTVLLPFKSGIYHLANTRPGTEFVPLWIDNINRVLPKGKFLPIPLLCEVHVGTPLSLREGETKEAFLERSRNALLALAPAET